MESFPPSENDYINALRIVTTFGRVIEYRGNGPLPDKLKELMERNTRIKEQGSKKREVEK